MTTGKKLSYYPGCTLKTKARNLEDAALGSLAALGLEVEEIPRWNCCGAVFSLADDDLIHQVAPVRNLVRTAEQGSDTLVTLCSQCYNVLARANQLVRDDAEKRDTINRFMDEEPDYNGEVEVQHLLPFLRDRIGWDGLKERVQVPLNGLKVATFYGCTLIRPESVAVNAPSPEIFEDFLRALGAEPVPFSASNECCGSYQSLANPEAEDVRAAKVIGAANASGAEALVLSCPLCEYNLGKRQPIVLRSAEGLAEVPTFYFTQLLALALGLEPEVCHLELNGEAALQLLKQKEFIAAASV
jgi:heterodisulfide reductase subunit B